MIGVEQALELLAGAALPRGAETVALADSLGRVLHEPIVADRDFPPTDRSAMDGFAIRSADAQDAGVTLRVVGEIPAGRPAAGLAVGPGEALRIFTGGVLPAGADAVVMVEQTREEPDAGTVRIDGRAVAGQHVRRRAEDQRRGELVLEPGFRVRAAEIAALASVGRTDVRVARRPVVAVLSTGDEVVEPEETPAEHQVRNSNATMLRALVAECGLESRYFGIAPDRPDALRRLLELGLESDLLLVTGGVSVGAYDLVGRALQEAGMRLLFHQVAMKPGKPILAGTRGDTLVVGLPGNPVSTYAGFAVFVAPALRRMSGLAAWHNVMLPARLQEGLRRRPGRVTYHLARLAPHQGRLAAWPVASSGSGDVLSLARANGFVVTPEQAVDLPAGSDLPALLWRAPQL